MTLYVRRLLWLASILGAAYAVAAHAQEPDTELPGYRIEVILFENTNSGATPEDPGLPELPPLDPIDLSEGGEAAPEAAQEPAQPPGSLFFQPASGFVMSDVADRLRRRSGYRVLVHEAWQQPGYERAVAQPVELTQLSRVRARGETTAPRAAPGPTDLDESQLNASATFYRSRYLHLILDVRLGNDGARQIRERRRMRIGELHYFDAPGLGAVATINRAEAPEPDAGTMPPGAGTP